MKRLSVVGGICASFLLGAAVTAVAQDEHQNDKQENAHPENRQEQARPQQQARPQEQARPDDRKNQQPQSGDRHEMTPQSEGRQEPQSGDRHPQKPEKDRQMQQQQERQNMEKQPGREQERHEQARPQEKQGEQARAERHEENHRRIPDSDFHAHFGHEHHFRPGRVQVYGGRPQFTHSGFVFELVEPWPTAWAYDDDDYYIDYVNDEYWLYSLRYPGVRLELIIIQ
ncbi:MAG TPA: hypothetical protein VNS62_00275 [Candidatus Udaeobacter sp.]|nr:hypothetical protein [Candidatus Udaeobacter sp.]